MFVLNKIGVVYISSYSCETIGYSLDKHKLMIFAIKNILNKIIANSNLKLKFNSRDRFYSSPTKRNLTNWFNELTAHIKCYYGIKYEIVKANNNIDKLDNLSIDNLVTESLIEDILVDK